MKSIYNNQRILITGGTSGLGGALAYAASERGARVAVVARHSLAADAAVSPPFHLITGDIAEKRAIHRIAGEAIAFLGGVDLLINNASTLGPTPLPRLLDTACEDLEHVLMTNLLGPFRLAKAMLPGMLLEGGGTVVNLSSDAAVAAYPTWGSYGVSKAALDHLSRVWQEELSPWPVRILSLDPGDMDTPMHHRAIPDADIAGLRDPAQVAEEMLDFLASPPRDGQVRFAAEEWRECIELPELNSATTSERDRSDAQLLVIDHANEDVQFSPRENFAAHFESGDVLVVNTAATLPASFRGRHSGSASEIEVRLAQNLSDDPADWSRWRALVFGPGDWRIRTEDRSAPPTLAVGDRFDFSCGLAARITAIDPESERFVDLEFDGPGDALVSRFYDAGDLIQYSHLEEDLELWDGQTLFATAPIALEAPSAAFSLNWHEVESLREKGVTIVPLLHAAGISSTGDPVLDARLPLPEYYRIPTATAAAVNAAKREHRRIIALGTSVVRALESAVDQGSIVVAGEGRATLILRQDSQRVIVDGIITGMHESGASHLWLLANFADETVIESAYAEAKRRGFRWHEYGDSCLIA